LQSSFTSVSCSNLTQSIFSRLKIMNWNRFRDILIDELSVEDLDGHMTKPLLLSTMIINYQLKYIFVHIYEKFFYLHHQMILQLKILNEIIVFIHLVVKENVRDFHLIQDQFDRKQLFSKYEYVLLECIYKTHWKGIPTSDNDGLSKIFNINR
jgi:hypothetical protein